MEFEYKKSKILADLIYGYILLIFSIFITIMIIRKLVIDWDEIRATNLLLFIIIFIPLFPCITYLALGSAIIRNKYFKRNLEEQIELDIQKKIIIVNNILNKTRSEINFDDVISVELYYSWNTNPFSSDLGFSKLNIKNRDIPLIITQNNLNQFHIYKTFRNRVTKNKSNFMNDIKITPASSRWDVARKCGRRCSRTMKQKIER